MGVLKLRLSGGIEAAVDGQPVAGLGATRAGFLVGYLALERGRMHGRGELAALLWPEAVPSVARANLRQMVHQLRRRLEACGAGDRIAADRQGLGLVLADGDEVDVEALTEPGCCGQPAAGGACCTARVALAHALDRHRGPLFGRDVDAAVGERAGAWLERRRSRFGQAVHDLAGRLAECCRGAGDHDRALAALRRYLEREPFDEPVQRMLLELLADAGRARAAVAECEAYIGQLEREAGRSPEAATLALRERLAAHAHGPGPVAAAQALPVEQRVVTVAALSLRPLDEQCLERRVAVVGAARERARERLVRHRAHVIDAHGGLLFAYFGYPAPVERSGPRAAAAAREAVMAAGTGVAASAALHAERVVTGSDPDLPDPGGELSSVAAGLVARAGTGDVLASAALRERSDFDQPVDRDPVTEHPVAAYRLCPSVLPDRAPIAAGALLAREAEFAELARTWRSARGGGARCAFVRGAPGLGKTRLLAALADAAAADGARTVTLRAMPHARERPLGAVGDTLNAWLSVPQDPPGNGPAARLKGWLDGRRGDPRASVAALSRLVDLPDANELRDDGDPGQVRRAILAALDHLVSSLANGPLVLVVEDVHWLDAATLAWIARLPESLAGEPVLLLASGRPEAECPWPDTDTTRLELEALDEESAARLLDGRVAPGALGRGQRERILALAGGVPLFIEELARVAGADQDLAPSAPTTLQELVLARLEGVGDARRIAELCAVAGESFLDTVIDRARESQDPPLASAIEQLVEAGLMVSDPDGDGGRHAWRHALYRESLLAALPGERATALHDRVADALMAGDATPETIAVQLEAAGRHEEAVTHRLRAGEQALLGGFARAAVRHFERALAAIPADRHWTPTQIDASIGLGTAHLVADGYGSSAVDDAFRGALAVPGVREDPRRHARVLCGLLSCASSHHGYAESRRLTAELDRIAEQTGDAVLAVGVRTGQAVNELFTGSVPDAIDRAIQARVLGRDCDPGSLVARFGDNPALNGGAIEGWAKHLAARPDEARRALESAARAADATGHAPTIAAVQAIVAVASQRADDVAAVADAVARLEALHEEGGFALWGATADALSLWATARRGGGCEERAVDAVAARVEEAMAGTASVFRLMLCDALWCADRIDAAWRMNEGCLRGIARVGDDAMRAEVHLQRARLYARGGEAQAARDELVRATARAQERAAPLLALEAAAGRAALPGACAADHDALARERERCPRSIRSPYLRECLPEGNT